MTKPRNVNEINKLANNSMHQLLNADLQKFSYRNLPLFGITRADNNIFFPLSTLYVYLQFKELLTFKNQQLLAKVSRKIRMHLSNYENKYGLSTFNFWQKKNGNHFPKGFFFRHFRYFELPDDADVSALAYLCFDDLPHPAEDLKSQLIKHSNANVNQKPISHLPKYQNYKAFSVWFGDKMPIEFDVCVHANILLFCEEYKLKNSQQYAATVDFLNDVIENELNFQSAFWLAPSYPYLPILLYHLARLHARSPFCLSKKAQDKIITLLKFAMQKEIQPFFKLLLANSMLRMGISNSFKIELNALHSSNQTWFVANFNTHQKQLRKLPQSIQKHFLFPFESKYFTEALFLENCFLEWQQKERT